MRNETETQRQNRLHKARDYKKKMISNETVSGIVAHTTGSPIELFAGW